MRSEIYNEIQPITSTDQYGSIELNDYLFMQRLKSENNKELLSSKFQEIERKMTEIYVQDVNDFHALTLIYKVEVTYGFIQNHTSMITYDYWLIMM